MFRNWFAARRPAPQARVFRPTFEELENRLTPAGTVTGALLNGTWTLTGDVALNDIVINSTGVAGAFTVVTGSFDTTTVSGTTSPTGVKRIVINFDDGNDRVQLNNNATPITLRGLTINGGNGDNRVTAEDFKIKGNLAITNLVGNDFNAITDFTVVATLTPGTGKVTINNGDGGSSTFIDRSLPGFNSIAKRLTVTNGSGSDNFDLEDTNVGGSVINDNGSGGGNFGIFNIVNTLTRSTIGGSVTVTFVDGAVLAQISDVVVTGNVTINTGSGTSTTLISDDVTTLPVRLKGRLTITGSGANDTVRVDGFGMEVSKSVKIILGSGAQVILNPATIGGSLTIDTLTAPTLDFFNLFVTGPTTII